MNAQQPTGAARPQRSLAEATAHLRERYGELHAAVRQVLEDFEPILDEGLLSDVQEELIEALAPIQPWSDDACFVCGCTEHYACEGGCGWAFGNVCTRCVAAADELLEDDVDVERPLPAGWERTVAPSGSEVAYTRRFDAQSSDRVEAHREGVITVIDAVVGTEQDFDGLVAVLRRARADALQLRELGRVEVPRG